MRIASVVLTGLAAATLMACSLRPPGGGGISEERNLISPEEVANANVSNLHELVSRLRPQWMNYRSRSFTNCGDDGCEFTAPTASVFRDGTHIGDLEYLKSMTPASVASLRYWEPGEASMRFGMGHPEGVIEVVSKGMR